MRERSNYMAVIERFGVNLQALQTQELSNMLGTEQLKVTWILEFVFCKSIWIIRIAGLSKILYCIIFAIDYHGKNLARSVWWSMARLCGCLLAVFYLCCSCSQAAFYPKLGISQPGWLAGSQMATTQWTVQAGSHFSSGFLCCSVVFFFAFFLHFFCACFFKKIILYLAVCCFVHYSTGSGMSRITIMMQWSPCSCHGFV